jgi:Ca2+-binding RTX toxin-like protein
MARERQTLSGGNFMAFSILGVVYVDEDNDDDYSDGEGIAGVHVDVDDASAVTAEDGGYELESFLEGMQTITLSPEDGDFPPNPFTPVTFETDFSASPGMTLDLIDLTTLQTSASGTMTGASQLRGLGLIGLELITGDGEQSIFGTQGDDTLSSGGDNDVLNGGSGDDTLNGESGNDDLKGGADDDTLNGGGGNDTLNGGTDSDTMAGGSGSDTYVVGQLDDIVIEGFDEGSADAVQSAVNCILWDNVERLTLTGSANRFGTGNDLNNTIVGNSGNNLLDGRGGADTVRGGGGADTLRWSSSDVLLDGGGGNNDTLKLAGSGAHLKLTTVANGKIAGIERIDLSSRGDHTLTLNASEVLDLSGTSNTLRVLGNSADTVHRGSGWTHGADKMISGQSYESYTKGLATLLVDSDINSVI